MPHKLSKNNSTKYVDTVAREQYRLIQIKRRASRTLLARARTATAMARSKDSASVEAQAATTFCAKPIYVSFYDQPIGDRTSPAIGFGFDDEHTKRVNVFVSKVRSILHAKDASNYLEDVKAKAEEKKIEFNRLFGAILQKMEIVVNTDDEYPIVVDIIPGEEFEKKFEESNNKFNKILEELGI